MRVFFVSCSLAVLAALPAAAQSPVVTEVAASQADLRDGRYRGAARANVERLDDVLRRSRRSYDRLDADERARIHQAFGDLIPGASFAAYRINAAQARAIVYLAFARDDDDSRGRDRDWDRDRRELDSAADAALWIQNQLPVLLRPQHPGRDEELRLLDDVSERARGIVRSLYRTGCNASGDAERLDREARESARIMRDGINPAWMSVGRARIERMIRLADTVEQGATRCMGGTRR